MADTVFTAIVDNAWTQVSVGSTGFVTNSADFDILFLEAATPPAASVTEGHTLRARQDVSYNLTAGQEMYARLLPNVASVDAKVAVTPS